MKILIILNSRFYTDEQNQERYNKNIEVDWTLPVLPNSNDIFDCDSIVDNMPEDESDLTWSVDFVCFKKIKSVITPILFLIGE